MSLKLFDEVLSFAIEKEQEAVELYEHAGGMSELPNVKAMFREMSEQELGHKRKLQHLDEIKAAATAVEKVPDLKISDYLVDVEFRPDMSYQDVLILAMKREESAFKLYTDMTNRSEDPDLAQLFRVLAQEEAKHKLSLETEYDERVLTEN